MAVQKQDDQHEHTFSSYVRIRDVVQKTCLGRWTIGRSGERGSGISVLPWWWWWLLSNSNYSIQQNSFVYAQINGSKYCYVRGAYDKFPVFFPMGIWNSRRLLRIQYFIAIHLMRWLTNCYDFRFKWTATAAIRIHPTKPWLSQLVNFKNTIWHFRRTIYNKILF